MPAKVCSPESDQARVDEVLWGDGNFGEASGREAAFDHELYESSATAQAEWLGSTKDETDGVDRT